jgi:ornithine carbamoyltransferase
MYPASWLSRLTSADRPSAEHLHALLERAQTLRQSSQHHHALTGKRLGLMSTRPEDEDAQLFEQAARDLGAHVALIPAPAEQSEGDDGQRLADIGRLLGQLYDTVECQGVSAETVKRLAEAGNLPMHHGLAGREHWIYQMAQGWPVSAPLADRRRWLIQAALLATLS